MILLLEMIIFTILLNVRLCINLFMIVFNAKAL